MYKPRPKTESVRSSSPGRKLTILVGAKPPFVAASKSLKKAHHMDFFGQPRTLSPLRGGRGGDSPKARFFGAAFPDGEAGGDFSAQIVEPDLISVGHMHLLQRQSVRWLYLTATFWSLVVLDARRHVDEAGLSQFMDVMGWRAHGIITEEEFSVLFAEWLSNEERSQLPGTNLVRQLRSAVGVFLARQLLLEKKITEPDLDLFIGMVVHETNIRMLNCSVKYNPQQQLNALNGGVVLEVCSSKWLSLSEELFFSLDTAGYGVLRFDEIFFLCACLTIGVQGWNDELELETDISLATLTATALQFLVDAGCNIPLNAHRLHVTALQGGSNPKSGGGAASSARNPGELLDEMDFEMSRAQSTELNKAFSPSPSKLGNVGKNVGAADRAARTSSKYAITLTMFKRFLVRKNVGESSLSALLAHMRTCIEKLARISAGAGTPDGDALYAATRPFEDYISAVVGGVSSATGSPRLWQQAVMTASGYPGDLRSRSNLGMATGSSVLVGGGGSRGHGHGGGHGGGDLFGEAGSPLTEIPAPPPIVLFLLSDGERMVSSNFRASGGASWSARAQGGNRAQNSIEATALETTQDDLNEAAYKIWAYFSIWGKAATIKGNIPGQMSTTMSQTTLLTSGNASMIMRDASFQLIVSALTVYKNLQEALCAALFDMTVTYFGLNRGFSSNIAVLCASLMPNPRAMLKELGAFGQLNLITANNSAPSWIPNPSVDAVNDTPGQFHDFASRVLGAAGGGNGGSGSGSTGASTPPTQGNSVARKDSKLSLRDLVLDESSTTTTTGGAGHAVDTLPQPRTKVMAPSQPLLERRRRSSSLETATATPIDAAANAAGVADSDIQNAQWTSLFDNRVTKKVNANSASHLGGLQVPHSAAADNNFVASDVVGAPAARGPRAPGVAAAPGTGSSGGLDSSDGSANSQAPQNSKPAPLSAEEATIVSHLLSVADLPQQLALLEQLRKIRTIDMNDSPLSKASSESERENAAAAVHAETAVPAKGATSAGQQQVQPQGGGGNRRSRSAGSRVVDQTPQSSNAAQAMGSSPANSVMSASQSASEVLHPENQNVGRYAQMLREILRKMSKDDSKVQQRSLEEVLKLGHVIALAESGDDGRSTSPFQEKKNDLFAMSPVSFGRRIPFPAEAARAVHVTGQLQPSPSRDASSSNATRHHYHHHQQQQQQQPQPLPSHITPARSVATPGSAASSTGATPGVYSVNRLSRPIPGSIPDPTGKRKDNTAFGHPVD